MGDEHYELGTVRASEAVIRDLYIKLRAELFRWSRVTFQTPQPRMGYVGQHLTSVVTGYPGGRSGARGKDLILPVGQSAEIKTCYRVDQLGSCRSCSAVVASVELVCQACGSTNIVRKDDSKWLISPKHDSDMRALYDPAAYYLVLFDFVHLESPEVINARIYEVDPKCKGFAYCMVDYYFNIRARSTSKAPFNLWPFSLNFQLMQPTLIYHAQIDNNDHIETLIFPEERGEPVHVELDALVAFARSRGLTMNMANAIAGHFDVPIEPTRRKLQVLEQLELARVQSRWRNSELVNVICEAMYACGIDSHREWLPAELR